MVDNESLYASKPVKSNESLYSSKPMGIMNHSLLSKPTYNNVSIRLSKTPPT